MLRSGRDASDSDIEIVVADTGKGISRGFPALRIRPVPASRCLDHTHTRRHRPRFGHCAAPGRTPRRDRVCRKPRQRKRGNVHCPASGSRATQTSVRRLQIERKSPNRGEISTVEKRILKGLRVLVVEDNAEDREVLLAELAHHGATVSASASAAEALAELDQLQPDILVADIGMPGEDGYSLIRKIRARPLDHGGLTPAIALTAYAGDANRKLALDAGYQKHMTKPADPVELAQTIFHLACEAGIQRQ